MLDKYSKDTVLEIQCKTAWYSSNLQVDCLINQEQLIEEVEFLRKNLRLQKHYATLLQDLDKSTTMLGKIVVLTASNNSFRVFC